MPIIHPRRLPSIIFAPLVLVSASALAAPAAQPVPVDASPSVFAELMGIVIPLILIIVVLLAVLYFARRRFGLTGQDAPLSIVQILPVGPRERVVVVKARSGRAFVVGVGAQNVNFVTNLDPEDLVSATAATTPAVSSAIHTSRSS